MTQRFYKPAVQSQRQVVTIYSFVEPHESGTCPFCGTVNTGNYILSNNGYIMPKDTCKHFVMFMMGAKPSTVTILFNGSSADLSEE